MKSQWETQSLPGPKRCQQSHQEGPLQDTYNRGNHTPAGRKQEVHQGQWNIVIPLHSP